VGGMNTRDFARKLRKEMTDTERFVWDRIRHRQIGGFKFRRQAPVGHFIVDFICFEAKVILEFDGDQHDSARLEDAARTHWLQSQGFRVARFWNHEVFEDWESIEAHLHSLVTAGSTPHPNPPPQGGREQESAA
jgi:very-short-patch-repair endonuclease